MPSKPILPTIARYFKRKSHSEPVMPKPDVPVVSNATKSPPDADQDLKLPSKSLLDLPNEILLTVLVKAMQPRRKWPKFVVTCRRIYAIIHTPAFTAAMVAEYCPIVSKFHEPLQPILNKSSLPMLEQRYTSQSRIGVAVKHLRKKRKNAAQPISWNTLEIGLYLLDLIADRSTELYDASNEQVKRARYGFKCVTEVLPEPAVIVLRYTFSVLFSHLLTDEIYYVTEHLERGDVVSHISDSDVIDLSYACEGAMLLFHDSNPVSWVAGWSGCVLWVSPARGEDPCRAVVEGEEESYVSWVTNDQEVEDLTRREHKPWTWISDTIDEYLLKNNAVSEYLKETITDPNQGMYEKIMKGFEDEEFERICLRALDLVRISGSVAKLAEQMRDDDDVV